MLLENDWGGKGSGWAAIVPLFLGGLALLAVVVSVPIGLAFGWATHALSRKLSDRLHTALTASNDPAQLAAASVPWLAGVAVAKRVASPLSWLGSSAVLAAAGAAWLAWRGGRRPAAAACCFLAVSTAGLGVWWPVHQWRAELAKGREEASRAEGARISALPVCYDHESCGTSPCQDPLARKPRRGALALAAERVPGVASATAELRYDNDSGDDFVEVSITASAGTQATALVGEVQRALDEVRCRRDDAKYGSEPAYVAPDRMQVVIKPAR